MDVFEQQLVLTLPSPVDVCADVQEKYVLPYPPVASTVFFANTLCNVPSSIDMQRMPTQAPSTISRSIAKNSIKKFVLCCRPTSVLPRHLLLPSACPTYLHTLPIKCMQHSMSRPIRRTTTPDSLASFTILQRLPSKRPLIDPPIFRSRESHPIILQFINGLRRFSAHVVYRILIS